jgi:hypothetical protein
MPTTFDKPPPLSKLAKCNSYIVIHCPPGMDNLKKYILKYRPEYSIESVEMDDEKSSMTIIRSYFQDDVIEINGVKKFFNIVGKQVCLGDTRYEGMMLKDLFHFYKGFICPKDKYFKCDFGNYYILNDKDEIERYLYIPKNDYPCCIKKFNEHVEKYKADLMMNKMEDWYTWFDIGKMHEFEKHISTDFIIYNTKKKNAFIKHKVHFPKHMTGLVPKIKGIDLKYIVSLINNSNDSNIKNIVVK